DHRRSLDLERCRTSEPYEPHAIEVCQVRFDNLFAIRAHYEYDARRCVGELMKLAVFTVVSMTACGADPTSYSSPVGINLKAKSGDVSNNAISDDKAITTESGNPYGAFVNDAQTRIGRDPAAIEIDNLTLALGAQSTGVTMLDQVYTGDVDV